ncbi:riboflavin biosynthesis protein RibD [Alsobacter metallidurans]|uniref:Riboflavin biosynthesis protein RibD n=1 Tax=Alsobacter metallidurans TaxID=340221 RepID=A0A917I6V2_9HYPH|nr:bifunctional diaminohydroxyphosphoribosylaminopyrimidine deaminase/5-amino-6-(5-phosphoribosylamino)uracil reductase RibD [Alsobacter metallidurans]GGH17455.1 riboflavin biosynthesis protein RibD [Alsobacter metallidurans]
MSGAADDDVATMRIALALARRGLGNTWPNPAVGAVVWKPGSQGPIILGRGWTQPGGRPHAEPVALAQAGAAARGATLSVTLEPCSHFGKTGPCSHAIIEAGIARVVSAIEDPDPRVNGRGHIILRAHGIDVTVGVLGREARWGNRGFIKRMVEGRPMVTVKLAQTADGFAGATGGPRLMITGPDAQARVHMLRAQHDAIMVGVGTVLADDPQLTCRLPGLEARSPVRVVLDSDLRTPAASLLARTAREVPTWVIAAADAPAGREASLLAAGVVVERVPRGPAGQGLDLLAALGAVAARGVTRVLCEGGPTLADALAAVGQVDALELITGPEPLGRPGLPAIGPALARFIDHDPHVERTHPVPLGRDLWQSFARRR